MMDVIRRNAANVYWILGSLQLKKTKNKDNNLLRIGTFKKFCQFIQLNIHLFVLHAILHTFAMLPFAYTRNIFYSLLLEN